VSERNLHGGVTASQSASPSAGSFLPRFTDAFPWTEAPRYLIRNRDAVFGQLVTRRLKSMGIRDRPTAPRPPWQNGCVERLIGSIRRECLDHLIVLGEAHPHRSRRLLLQRAADAPVTEQRRPNPSTDPPDRSNHSRAHARWPAPPILSDVVSGSDRPRPFCGSEPHCTTVPDPVGAAQVMLLAPANLELLAAILHGRNG